MVETVYIIIDSQGHVYGVTKTSSLAIELKGFIQKDLEIRGSFLSVTIQQFNLI